ncbi:MAG: NAD-dependent epimerase/dehydratase family protein [Sandaracinaceae bacterium]|nr:NAD-dependent epimerase/dehydratase family protein [Sandaracinaceae bacterium]
MKVLITGATGYLGAAILRRLLDDGIEVQALVRTAAQKASLEEMGCPSFVGTVGDPNEVAAAAAGCTVIVHAAAVTSARSARRALDWTNIAGTENVLTAARHAHVRRVVYISCSDVTLSNEHRVHWNEDRTNSHPLLDAHAESKRLAEDLVLPASGNDLETIAIRPALVWGPGDHTTLPALCREALENNGLTLFGDGRNLVSTLYIDNFVDAVVAALDAEGAAGRAYYIADVEFLEAREFYGKLSFAAHLPRPRGGLGFEISYLMAALREWRGAEGPRRADVVRRAKGSHFDTQNARTKLGWEPRVSIEDGMLALEAWVEQQGGAAAVAKLQRPAVTADSVDAQVEKANRAA